MIGASHSSRSLTATVGSRLLSFVKNLSIKIMAESKQLEVCGDPACAQKLASYQKVVGEKEIKIAELDEKLDTACQKRSENQIALIEARNEILSLQTRISSSMQNAMRPTEEEVALREQLHGMQAENASVSY